MAVCVASQTQAGGRIKGRPVEKNRSCPMRQIALITRRADAFCARLNGGLSAVAVALAVLTGAAAIARLPLPAVDTQTGAWLVDPTGASSTDVSP
jgi:hypothetical protein